MLSAIAVSWMIMLFITSADFFFNLTLLVLVESSCSVLFRGTINWVNDAAHT